MQNDADILGLIGRQSPILSEDMEVHASEINEQIKRGKFLVVGGAGSIGGAVVRELFSRNPAKLHIIDIAENNLAELVRDLRSSVGYTDGEFHAYCFDALGPEFEAFAQQSSHCDYDYILNFSALKHVRSEKDPFTLMRLLDVNVFLPKRLHEFASQIGARKFFCVSTDKATKPVNAMGASKLAMEYILSSAPSGSPVSTARFANVAFSDGSLPHSWKQRLAKAQPIVAPHDVRRYFITEREGALLCLLSAFQGKAGDVYFPKLNESLHLITFSDMARRFLKARGLQAHECKSEEEARASIERLRLESISQTKSQSKWPCYFFETDTDGEKEFEEFYSEEDSVEWNRYKDIGVIRNAPSCCAEDAEKFQREIEEFRESKHWTLADIITALQNFVPTFEHHHTGKHLDKKM